MSGVASKNLYDLLGNDPELDPDREQPPPVIPVDKPVQRTGKRNDANGTAPEPTRGGRGGRGSGREGNDAFKNPPRNRERPVGAEDGTRQDRNATRTEGGNSERARDSRSGRGRGRGRGNRDDRHSRHTGAGPNDHAKQAAHGWGENTGAGEWTDEKAGDAIAAEEEKGGFDAVVDPPVNADGEAPTANGEPAAEPEPEDKSKSYDEYLKELAEKKLGLGGVLTARKANEGAAKKQPEGKEYAREGDADYFAGKEAKAKRERERKEKSVLQLDHDIQPRERERDAPRGGRGGRGRGRGEGGFRGEGRGRGGRGRGEGRGEFRGRGGRGGSTPIVLDSSAFPSLGA